MNTIMHFNVLIFPFILVTIIYITIQKQKIRTVEDRLFQSVLFVISLALLFDITAVVTESLENPKLTVLVLIPFLINLILILLTPFTGWIFNISSNGCYVRGPYFFLPYLYSLYNIGYSILVLLHQIKKKPRLSKRKEYQFLVLLTMIPVAGAAIQICFYGAWLALPSSALTDLILYIHTQNHQVTLDALTGLNNRDYFDRYLREQTLHNDTWYLFILDMNHFKQINDIYGHTAGDQALREIADILKRSVFQQHAFLARYGGDEFAIIFNCDSDKQANDFIRNLKVQTAQYNRKHSNPYELSFSAGFARYESKYEHCIENFIAAADKMMYLDKGEKRR